MVALRRDEFVLALFQGAPQAWTRAREIRFGLDADEIDWPSGRDWPKDRRLH